MSTLISPGVDVQVSDDAFYPLAQASGVPLLFIATGDEKLQADGVTPAIGTFESGVLRTVTSIKQALQLYGIPEYLTSASGQPFHGDCRNEYGLDALLKVLDVADLAYVIRANVNLNDSLADLKAMWASVIADAGAYLESLVTDWLTQYNDLNGFIPADGGYKTSISKATMKTLVDEALVVPFSKYSFSSDRFMNAFLMDHSITQAGYQDVLFNQTFGLITATDLTGLVASKTYEAHVSVVTGTGTVVTDFSFLGSDVVTFGDLVAAMNASMGSDGTASIVQGRLRITSPLTGSTSVVAITDGALSSNDGALALFGSLNLYRSIATAFHGVGAATLSIYDDSYNTITGSYDGLYGIITNWSTGSIVGTEFSPDEADAVLVAAAGAFDNTKEFRGLTSLGSNDATRRAAVVAQMQAAINNVSAIGDLASLEYDLVAAPGFPEVSDELVSLSIGNFEEVQVIGELPFDKPPVGPNSAVSWGLSTAKVSSKDIGYYYGHGLSSNIDGATILTTSAATALRTYAYSDSVSEGPWIAPAGATRGTCPHLTDVGYVSGTLGGPTTFVSNHLDRGSCDALYQFPVNINPISFVPGRGILVMGQKTTSPLANPEDRVNVARLAKYLKRTLRKELFSFTFEPNDDITRKNIKSSADNILASLVTRRGLYDFASICDSSNNVPGTIDEHIIYLDVAIKPVITGEFIYARIAIVNTGANIGTGATLNN
jgi:hypothetical protein